jgi:predicted Zn-dependent protease
MAPKSFEAEDARMFLKFSAFEANPTLSLPAEGEIASVLKRRPDYLPASMAKAIAEAQNGRTEVAIQDFEQILRGYPDFPLAQKHLAKLYFNDPTRDETTFKLADKAHESLPDDPEIASILAQTNYRRKDYGRAVQLLQETARRKPLDGRELFILGMSQLQTSNRAAGRETLEKAVAAALEEPLATEAKRALQQVGDQK